MASLRQVASKLPQMIHSTWAEVHLGNITNNIKYMKAIANQDKRVDVMAVVKANG